MKKTHNCNNGLLEGIGWLALFFLAGFIIIKAVDFGSMVYEDHQKLKSISVMNSSYDLFKTTTCVRLKTLTGELQIHDMMKSLDTDLCALNGVNY